MIRSASKNWRSVAVVTDPRLYPDLVAEMKENDGSLSMETRKRLATLAYTRTASYDLAISSYLAEQLSDDELEQLEQFNPLGDMMFIDTDDDEGEEYDLSNPLPPTLDSILDKVTDLRYGENPHQKAALYTTGNEGGIANAEQLLGKEMSYNNYVDADAAWNLVQDFDDLAVAIIKHTQSFGVGLGSTNLEAYERAATDPVSASRRHRRV